MDKNTGLEDKITSINERVIRTEEKLDVLLEWKDTHEAQDANMFNKLEHKQEQIQKELSSEIGLVQRELGDLKLDTITLLGQIRRENAEGHLTLADRIAANAVKIAWMIGIGVGIQTVVLLLKTM